MSNKINKLSIYTALFMLLAAAACKKEADIQLLPLSDVQIKQALSTDTTSISVSTEKDSIITFKIEAVSSNKLQGKHVVVIGVDTTQMAVYNNKYGKTPILPGGNYFIPIAESKLSGGTSIASAEINILNQSQLTQGLTYVLPLVITSVDNQTPEKNTVGQVIYLLVKAKPIDYGTAIDKTTGGR